MLCRTIYVFLEVKHGCTIAQNRLPRFDTLNNFLIYSSAIRTRLDSTSESQPSREGRAYPTLSRDRKLSRLDVNRVYPVEQSIAVSQFRAVFFANSLHDVRRHVRLHAETIGFTPYFFSSGRKYNPLIKGPVMNATELLDNHSYSDWTGLSHSKHSVKSPVSPSTSYSTRIASDRIVPLQGCPAA